MELSLIEVADTSLEIGEVELRLLLLRLRVRPEDDFETVPPALLFADLSPAKFP